jgi:hypothetical protein
MPTGAAGIPTFDSPVPVDALARDEGGAARGTRLLTIRVGEKHALLGQAVDVGRAIAHEAMGVAAEVGLPDVIAPDDEDVRLPTLFPLFAGAAFLVVRFAMLSLPSK